MSLPISLPALPTILQIPPLLSHASFRNQSQGRIVHAENLLRISLPVLIVLLLEEEVLLCGASLKTWTVGRKSKRNGRSVILCTHDRFNFSATLF